MWPIILFLFTFVIGCIAPLSGVGGGVIFVPIATAFSPFSVDFVRGTGLILALTTSLFSVPQFLRTGLANLKITALIVSVSTITSILGAMAGLWVTNSMSNGDSYTKIALGGILFLVFAVMALAKGVDFPEEVEDKDSLSAKLGLTGSWFEPTLNKVVKYRATRLLVGIVCFAVVGFIAGMFGLGAGWANVPALNLIMGFPIKAAAATSMTIIAVNDSAAAWIYMAGGSVLILIVMPSIIGASIGARVGAKLALRVKPSFVRYLVIGILFFASLTNIYKGLQGLDVF